MNGVGPRSAKSYSEQERERAIAWKHSTPTLPEEARAAAPYLGKGGRARGPAYDFCLPPEFAAYSLLPEVREDAIGLFRELGIPWHAGVGDGPGNHLLSSQVQCVNALASMVRDPERIRRAFDGVLKIGRLLEIEPGRHLTFEYIGPTDFFGESPGGARTRGAKCTSVDAAFLHEAPDGVMELVLVEWKYTESYPARPREEQKDATRTGRYASFVEDPDGPVRSGVLPFELLLDEPFYQLVRQQLLAHELEKAGAEGAGRVRVVHVLPPANLEYQQSLPRTQHQALGDSVDAVWSHLLRAGDRFTHLDPKVFLDPEVTSREYCLRYADDVIHGESELVEALELEPGSYTDLSAEVENALYTDVDFDGDVTVHPDGVELIVGGEGTQLEYPFRLTELWELARELDEE